MVDLLNLARMTVASAPGTGGSVAMSAAVPGYLTFDLAGAVDGRTYRYAIRDGVNRELSSGVYTASTKTLTRTVLKSTNGDAAINATIAAVVGSVVAAEDIIFQPLAEHNIIVNGDFAVSQQFGNTAVGTGSSGYWVDQWAMFAQGGVVATIGRSQSTPPGGFANYLHMVVSTADVSIASTDVFHCYQPIEGYRIARLNWGSAAALPVVLGFWARSSITGTFGVSIKNASAARSYVTVHTINVANTWEYKTALIPGDTTGTWPTNSAVGAYLVLTFLSGATFQGVAGWQAGGINTTSAQTNFGGTVANTFDITGVSLTPGSVVPSSNYSALLFRNYDDEYRICLRYWAKSYAEGTAPGALSFDGNELGRTPVGSLDLTVHFQVPMRTVPTIVFYSPSSGVSGKFYNFTGPADVNGNQTWQTNKAFVAYYDSAAANDLISFHWTADARM